MSRVRVGKFRSSQFPLPLRVRVCFHWRVLRYRCLFDQSSSNSGFSYKNLMPFVGSKGDVGNIAVARPVSGRLSLPNHPTDQQLLLKEHQILQLEDCMLWQNITYFSGGTGRAPFPVPIKLMKACSTDVFRFVLFPAHVDSLLVFYHPKPSSISKVATFLDFTVSSP